MIQHPTPERPPEMVGIHFAAASKMLLGNNGRGRDDPLE
jgi:hypothetical protein